MKIKYKELKGRGGGGLTLMSFQTHMTLFCGI